MNITNIIEFANTHFRGKTVNEVSMAGLSSSIVKYIQYTSGKLRVPTNLVYGEVLTIIGAMLGKKVTVVDGDYRNRCNLFSAVVSVASGGKSPSMNRCLRPVNVMENQNYEEYLKAHHAAKDKGDDLPGYDKQLVASNETIENLYRVLSNVKAYNNGLLMHQDELLTFFGSNAKKYSDGNIISDFLTLFDAFSPLRVGRVRMEVPIYVADPFLAILGGIQKKRIPEMFVGQEHNGFFSRWQWWLPNDDSPFIEDVNPIIDRDWAEILERATSSEMNNVTLSFEDEKLLHKYDDDFRQIRDWLEDNDEDDLSETIMKQGYVIRRLAGIIHCINALAVSCRPSDIIKSDTLEYAAQIIERLFINSSIVQRVIADNQKKRITGREAIIALDAEFGIQNQSLLSAALGGHPSQPYIARVLQEAKKDKFLNVR